MSGPLAAAMEQGCWCELQGAYFPNWNARKMTIPYASVGEQWWDAHFLSLDYGFGKSSASAHLHVCTQDARIKTIGLLRTCQRISSRAKWWIGRRGNGRLPTPAPKLIEAIPSRMHDEKPW